MLKFLIIFFAFLLLPFSSIADQEEASNFEINHANNLEILPDKIILQGAVSVSSLGQEPFTLNTGKMISLKNAAGDFGDIETFGASTITSEKFVLKAQKLYFRKDLKTNKYNLLDAQDKVQIYSSDGAEIIAPKVKIALDTKKLYAFGGVESKQIIEENGKKQKAIITSQEQEIDLNQQAKGLHKQLIAKKSVKTVLEQATITSNWAELFTLNGKGERAIFIGNAELLSQDGSKGKGQKITYFLQEKLLIIEAGSKINKASLIREDGTEILGNIIRYNTETNLLLVEGGSQVASLKRSDGTEIIGSNIKYNTQTKELDVTQNNDLAQALLKVPVKEKDGSTSYISIKANSILNEELKAGETLLIAKQKDNQGLVEIEYGSRKGWGKRLFITQNQNIPDKKADQLILVENAKLIDFDKKQILEGPIIQIGLGQQNLYSGFTGRAKGIVPIEKK